MSASEPLAPEHSAPPVPRPAPASEARRAAAVRSVSVPPAVPGTHAALAPPGAGKVAPLPSPPPAPAPEPEATPSEQPEEPPQGFFDWVLRILSWIGRAFVLLFDLVRKPGLEAPAETTPMLSVGEPGVSPATSGNRLELLVDGDELRPSLLDEIQKARRSIWLNVFELHADDAGRQVAEALLAARARGVEVKLVVDNRREPIHFSDGPPKNPWLDRLAAAGCEIRRPQGAGFGVNHRKLMVLDGERALVMGMNVGGNYLFDRSAGWTYHDAAVRLSGPAVHDVAAVFADSWERAGGPRLALPARLPPQSDAGAGQVQVVSHTGGKDRNVEREIVQRIDAESERVVLVNGFGMTDPIREALLRARARGVPVTWLWGQASHQSSVMAQESFQELSRAGVDIRQYPGPLHMKAYVFGGDKLIVGSANLDGFSGWLNDEAVLQIHSRDFVQSFEQRVLQPDLAKSPRVQAQPVPRAGVGDALIGGLLEPIID